MLKHSATFLLLFFLSACSQVPEYQYDERDPLQSINRPVYDFNMDVLDAYILRPTAVGYIAVTPVPVRQSVVHFTNNISAPIDIINAGLQVKPASAGINFARFLVNSTVGLLGVFDVASSLGLNVTEEDFGQTLGVWGIGDGAYLMLPGMGPSTTRNLAGDIIDNAILPNIALTTPQTILVFALKVVETRASLMAQEGLLNDSLDPYLFIKDIYFQRQLYELYDGNPPLKDEPDDFDEDFLESLEY